MPLRWKQAVRWYRRASRSVGTRRTVGVAILATLDETRELTTSMNCVITIADATAGGRAIHRCHCQPGAIVRLAEDAAYGLRWIEINTGMTLDPCRSLVGVVPMKLN